MKSPLPTKAGNPAGGAGTLYRRFYQVDSSHQQEGNGLGLALCKQILDDCGGTIREENQSPCGCRFIVTLPEKMTGEEAKQEETHGTEITPRASRQRWRS